MARIDFGDKYKERIALERAIILENREMSSSLKENAILCLNILEQFSDYKVSELESVGIVFPKTVGGLEEPYETEHLEVVLERIKNKEYSDEQKVESLKDFQAHYDSALRALREAKGISEETRIDEMFQETVAEAQRIAALPSGDNEALKQARRALDIELGGLGVRGFTKYTQPKEIHKLTLILEQIKVIELITGADKEEYIKQIQDFIDGQKDETKKAALQKEFTFLKELGTNGTDGTDGTDRLLLHEFNREHDVQHDVVMSSFIKKLIQSKNELDEELSVAAASAATPAVDSSFVTATQKARETMRALYEPKRGGEVKHSAAVITAYQRFVSDKDSWFYTPKIRQIKDMPAVHEDKPLFLPFKTKEDLVEFAQNNTVECENMRLLDGGVPFALCKGGKIYKITDGRETGEEFAPARRPGPA